MATIQKDRLASAMQETKVLLEISSGTCERYKVDPESHAKELRGTLRTPLPQDLHYGFMPHTEAEDGDELDMIVVSSRKIAPGEEVSVRPIGILISKDERAPDDKIIAVDKNDPAYSDIYDIDFLPPGMRGTIWNYTLKSKQESSRDGYVRLESFGSADAAASKIQEAAKQWVFGIERRDMI